jgi:hypothetical protein
LGVWTCIWDVLTCILGVEVREAGGQGWAGGRVGVGRRRQAAGEVGRVGRRGRGSGRARSGGALLGVVLQDVALLGVVLRHVIGSD